MDIWANLIGEEVIVPQNFIYQVDDLNQEWGTLPQSLEATTDR